MIVKVKCGSGWKMYETKEVAWDAHDEKCGIGLGHFDSVEFIETDPETPAQRGPKFLYRMKQDGGAEKLLITNETVYILNDNGKTIERI